MKKCPRCNHDINDNDRFCPHCGFDLQRKYTDLSNKRRFSFMPFIAVIFLLSFIPVAFSSVMDLFTGQLTPAITQKEQKLNAIKDHEPRQVVARFNTLADFNHKYTNVDNLIEEVELYEQQLHQKRNDIFDKDYLIDVYDNNNVNFELTYTTNVNSQYDIKIVRIFDRKKTKDETQVSFIKKNAHSFEELLLNEEDKKVLYAYIQDKRAIENIINDFSLKKAEFDKQKDTLGHYGIGVYQKDLSMVAKRYHKEYRCEINYTK